MNNVNVIVIYEGGKSCGNHKLIVHEAIFFVCALGHSLSRPSAQRYIMVMIQW